MNTRNSCYTYFAITGKFDPNAITTLLQLNPDKSRQVGALRPNGTAHDTASWQFGRCSEYDAHVENMMRRTIAPLLDKIPLLNQIRETYDVTFYLVIVPTVYAGEISPCLAPSSDIIDFCHATRTEIDVDLYVCDSGT